MPVNMQVCSEMSRSSASAQNDACLGRLSYRSQRHRSEAAGGEGTLLLQRDEKPSLRTFDFAIMHSFVMMSCIAYKIFSLLQTKLPTMKG